MDQNRPQNAASAQHQSKNGFRKFNQLNRLAFQNSQGFGRAPETAYGRQQRQQ